MKYFPQLSTGALSQYPVHKRLFHRTLANALEDGSRVVFADARAASISWEMHYRDISDEESATLLAFFISVEGRLDSFTFFDPVGNLMGWSETCAAPAWQRNGLINVTASVPDSLFTTRASTLFNAGSASLSFGQELSIPGGTTCCWSFYGRTDAAQSIELKRISGPASANVIGRAGPTWRRFELSSNLSSGGPTSIFQLSLPAGVALDVFGFQVEAQPAASQYVKTPGPGGVFPATRFDMDELTIISTGPNQNSCTLHLVTRVTG